MNYPDSVQFLYALGNEMKTAKLGLERIEKVLRALGNPERAYRVVHVAGTNGKGSTCAMIDAGLRRAGVRTGLFTSPHLIEPTERIQIDGIQVSKEKFAGAFEVVHQTALKLDLDAHPTYFETVTAMAFWLFREMGVETAVVEVGLGGRLDSTNVVQPVVTVITPIDMDHQAYLGNTMESIAAEKAGILKSGAAAVFAKQNPAALRVLKERAKEVGVVPQWADGYEIRDLETHARGSRFGGRSSSGRSFDEINVPLAGDHQVDNAITAALALEQLGVSPKGIADTFWPGRLEFVSPNPDVLLDGAHNPAGAAALRRYLEKHHADRKRWIIFGSMSDKAVEEIANILFPMANELIVTAPAMARAVAPEELASLAERIIEKTALAVPSISAAMQFIADSADDEDLVVITGSLYLVGEARAWAQTHAGDSRKALYNKDSWPSF